MFDIGWIEFLFVSVMALLVLGPKELPGVLRALGRMTAKIKSLNTEFRSHLTQLEDEVNLSSEHVDVPVTKSDKPEQKSGKSDDLFSTLDTDDHG
ncbi:MAG: Sec-independent protein translocase subunit TatA/TatB [Parvibaculales bacterium]